MAAPRPAPEEDTDEILGQEEFIVADDVEGEVTLDDGDAPMDEDDENAQDGDEDVEDTTIQNFSSHSPHSVFTVSAHPSQPLAVSGGEDEVAFIWDVRHGEEVVKLTGHSDSVSCAEWSFDGEMIATGGMDGRVRIWRRVGKVDWKMWEFVTELSGPDEVMWLKWHPKGNVLLAGSNDGTVWLWQLPSGNTMQVFAGHEGPVQVGTFTADGKRIITGDAAGTLIMWDPRSTSPVWKMTPLSPRFGMHEGITALAANSTSTVAVVGGAVGEVRVVNLAKGDVLGVLEGHKEGESVEAIEFVNWSGLVGSGGTGGVVATGATDGKICIWDLGPMKLRYTLEHTDSITSLHASPAPRSHQVTSSSSDKTLKTWDTRSGELLATHSGHRGPVLGASVGAFEEYVYVLSAGDDGACLVFDAKL